MRLVHVIAASIAALALAVGSANAETVTSGQVDIHYANVNGDGVDADVWGLAGQVAFPLGETVGAQLDLGWNNVDTDLSGDEDATAGTAHLYTRNESHLLGGFVGAADSDSSTTWGAGLEGEWYFDNSTAGARLTYLNNDDSNVDFWGVDAHYRYFATDNLSINGSIGYGQADNSGDNIDVTSIGLDAEYQLDSAPVSFFGGVSYANADSNFGSTDATVTTVGLRWNFGQDSLKSRDRTGASLAGIGSAAGGVAGLF